MCFVRNSSVSFVSSVLKLFASSTYAAQCSQLWLIVTGASRQHQMCFVRNSSVSFVSSVLTLFEIAMQKSCARFERLGSIVSVPSRIRVQPLVGRPQHFV